MAKPKRGRDGPTTEAFIARIDRLYHAMTAALGARDRVAWLQSQGASAEKLDTAVDDAFDQVILVVALARALERDVDDIGRHELALVIATIEAQADAAPAAKR
jgi:hypothetical protein